MRRLPDLSLGRDDVESDRARVEVLEVVKVTRVGLHEDANGLPGRAPALGNGIGVARLHRQSVQLLVDLGAIVISGVLRCGCLERREREGRLLFILDPSVGGRLQLRLLGEEEVYLAVFAREAGGDVEVEDGRDRATGSAVEGVACESLVCVIVKSHG